MIYKGNYRRKLLTVKSTRSTFQGDISLLYDILHIGDELKFNFGIMFLCLWRKYSLKLRLCGSRNMCKGIFLYYHVVMVGKSFKLSKYYFHQTMPTKCPQQFWRSFRAEKLDIVNRSGCSIAMCVTDTK